MEPKNLTNNPETQSVSDPLPSWLLAVRAAESKKAADISVIDLRGVTTFTDYFVICTGTNPRQIQAIADEVIYQLKQQGEKAVNWEGYDGAEWILIDYSDFVVHVFSEQSRKYYALERLWRHAKFMEIPETES